MNKAQGHTDKWTMNELYEDYLRVDKNRENRRRVNEMQMDRRP